MIRMTTYLKRKLPEELSDFLVQEGFSLATRRLRLLQRAQTHAGFFLQSGAERGARAHLRLGAAEQAGRRYARSLSRPSATGRGAEPGGVAGRRAMHLPPMKAGMAALYHERIAVLQRVSNGLPLAAALRGYPQKTALERGDAAYALNDYRTAFQEYSAAAAEGNLRAITRAVE